MCLNINKLENFYYKKKQMRPIKVHMKYNQLKTPFERKIHDINFMVKTKKRGCQDLTASV